MIINIIRIITLRHICITVTLRIERHQRYRKGRAAHATILQYVLSKLVAAAVIDSFLPVRVQCLSTAVAATVVFAFATAFLVANSWRR